DRVALTDAKQTFRSALPDYVAEDNVDEESQESFPASDAPASNATANGKRAHAPTPVTLADGTSFELEQRAVVIAAITSCSNGCTTCIGNSGPLPDEISAAVNASDLAVVSVLSGNRNFEGRINPDVKMNYLASPPLVVAYALAGIMDLDLTTEPLGADADGKPVYLHDVWPTPAEVQQVIDESVRSEMFTHD